VTTVTHHANLREVLPGQWVPARPLRDTSVLHRWRQERACRQQIGHCWHPEDLIGWWCCLCSAETDGMPAHNCRYCAEEAP
jgi:hypothetical protein